MELLSNKRGRIYALLSQFYYDICIWQSAYKLNAGQNSFVITSICDNTHLNIFLFIIQILTSIAETKLQWFLFKIFIHCQNKVKYQFVNGMVDCALYQLPRQMCLNLVFHHWYELHFGFFFFFWNEQKRDTFSFSLHSYHHIPKLI